jgi:hypothetical protein
MTCMGVLVMLLAAALLVIGIGGPIYISGKITDGKLRRVHARSLEMRFEIDVASHTKG